MSYVKTNLKFDLDKYIKNLKIDQNNIFSNKIKININNLLDEYRKKTILTTLTDEVESVPPKKRVY